MKKSRTSKLSARVVYSITFDPPKMKAEDKPIRVSVKGKKMVIDCRELTNKRSGSELDS